MDRLYTVLSPGDPLVCGPASALRRCGFTRSCALFGVEPDTSQHCDPPVLRHGSDMDSRWRCKKHKYLRIAADLWRHRKIQVDEVMIYKPGIPT